jgi:sulfite exporter TauE/SafE
MNLAFYISAFTLGFLGSFHCAGMCGPIAMVLPVKSNTPSAIFTGRFIYNFGRIVTYILLGLLFGLVGFSIILKGLQQELGIITGVVILTIAFMPLRITSKFRTYTSSNSYTTIIRKNLKKLFIKKSKFSLFLIGSLNGLLPCGFVYLAIAGATSAGTSGGGMIYMTLFGLGTFPMMMMISTVAGYLGIRFRKIFSRVSTIISIAFGIFLIFRSSYLIQTNNCETVHQSPSPVYCPVSTSIQHNK